MLSGLPRSPVTNSNGYYSATVSYGWNGSVTPTKTSYTFSPTARSYNGATASQSDQDYTGSVIQPIISGYVRSSNGTTIEGVTLGGLPLSSVTNSGGVYSASVTYGWNGTVRPTKYNYTFSPTSRSYRNVTSNQSDRNYTGTPSTGVEKIGLDEKPSVFALDQNYPNPFNSETHVRYKLPEAGEVFLAVYDVWGQLICTLDVNKKQAGCHEAIWYGKNNAGETVSSGVYFLRMVVCDRVFLRKILFVK